MQRAPWRNIPLEYPGSCTDLSHFVLSIFKDPFNSDRYVPNMASGFQQLGHAAGTWLNVVRKMRSAREVGAAEAAKVDAASFKSQIRDAMDEAQVARVNLSSCNNDNHAIIQMYYTDCMYIYICTYM